MKKLILFILTISTFFSIVSVNAASNSYMESILNLNFGIEEYKFTLPTVDKINFTNENSKRMYEEFESTDGILRNEVMRLYKNGEIEYYTMNGIISEYELFVYHINKLFYYMKMKETSNYRELDSIILEHYETVKTHYERTKYLLSQKPRVETTKVHCYNYNGYYYGEYCDIWYY